MSLTIEQMNAAVDRHFAFEAADDVEGVLATLSPEVVHDVVGAPTGPTVGPEGARAFYAQLFADLADGRMETLRRLHGPDFVVDESLWSGRAVGRPFGFEGRGRPLQFRLLHVMEFAADGSIRRENVWLDVPAIVRQLSQA